MQNVGTFHRASKRHRQRLLWRSLLVGIAIYGVYAAWRLFPRFDDRLTGTWEIADRPSHRATITFFEGGFGQRGTERSRREFRWWVSDNALVMHEDRRSRSANLATLFHYGMRKLVFLNPPSEVSEFDIARLDSYGAHLNRRPRLIDRGVVESLVLRR